MAGGCFELPDNDQGHSDRVILWQLQTHTTSKLQLAEVSAAHGQIGAAVLIEIEGQAFSGAAYSVSSSGDAGIYLLFSNKSAARLRLPAPGSSRHHGSALDALGPASLQWLRLGPQLATLGAPAALAVVGGHLVVAGASDTAACVPAAAFNGGDASATQHLSISTSLLQRLVGSLYQPAQRAGAVAALPAADAAGRPLLALVTGGAALRVWAAPPAQQLLASHELLPGAAARQLVPRAALAAGGIPNGELLVVSQLEASDAPGATTLAACHIRIGEGAEGGDGGVGASGVVARFALQLPSVSARLLGAQLRGGVLHVLAGLPGGETRLMAFGAGDGSYLGGARLLSKGPGPEWGVNQDLWAAALSAFPGSTSPEDSVMGQLLVPGQLCRAALREALLYYGAALAHDQVDGAGYEQLKVYLRAALLSVSARHPAYGEAQCWHTLFARYCECWQQLHSPLALAAAGGGAWLGVVRGGLMLTLLRPATGLEQQEDDGVAAAGPAGVSAAQNAAVRSCLRAIGQALGSPSLRLMMRLVTAGVDVEGELLPGMVDLLLYGPQPLQQQQQSQELDLLAGARHPGQGAPKDAAGGASDAVRRRLADWRAARQAALLHVHQALDGLTDPIQSISDFVEELLQEGDTHLAPFDQGGRPTHPQIPQPLGSALCSAVLQASRARCMAVQRLMLLLGVVQQMGRAGNTPLSPEQQARVRSQLVPRLSTALRASAVALWLCKTPAALPPGAAAGAASSVLPQHLEALQLGGTPRAAAGTPRTPGPGAGAPWGGAAPGPLSQQQARAQRPAQEQPMAAHMLRAFCEARPGEAAAACNGALAPAVAAFSSYLSAGATAASAGGARGGVGGAAALGIEERALHVGWRLFCSREFAGVGALVELAGGRAPSDAGMAFLLGVSLACRLRGVGAAAGGGGAATAADWEQAQARRELLDAASGHLFRAAAGLAAPGAAPLRGVLQQLRRRQQRGGAGGGGALGLDLSPPPSDGGGNGGCGQRQPLPAEAVPGLRLEFFEAVMRLFESEECLEGALEFARAALGAVDTAYSARDPARRERQGMLWMAVFTYASRLGRYTDAYAAATANPIPQQRLECVRRLVHRLAEERQLGALCGLPFAGVVRAEPTAADPAPQPVPLVAVAVQVLTRRAQHSTLAGSAAPRGAAPRGAAHMALFDFLVCWGDHKGAAAAMLGLAWRLLAEAHQSEESIREVEDAYAAALNQLELLDPSEAWLDLAHPLLADCAPAAVQRRGSGQHGSAAPEGIDGDGEDPAGPLALAAARQLRRRRGNMHGSEHGVVTLAALRKEAALFEATAALFGSLPGLQVLQGPVLPADYVYDQTLGAGRLTEAEVLAHALWHGSELEERLERLAAAAAASSARVQVGTSSAAAESADGTASLNDRAWWGDGGASSSGGQQLGYLGSAAAPGWQQLRGLLSRYETAQRRRLAGRLRVAAIDAALSESPAITLPQWLTAPFLPGSGGGSSAITGGGSSAGMACGPDDPSALLQVYLRHGRLSDAADLVLAHLAAWQGANPLVRCKPAAAWMPMHQVELLDVYLADAVAAAQQQQQQQQQGKEPSSEGFARRLAGLKAQMRAAVAEHLALSAQDSRMAVTTGTGGGGSVGMALG